MKIASSDIHGFFNAACPVGGHYREITNAAEVRTENAKPEYAEDELYGPHLVIVCDVCEGLVMGSDSWTGDPGAIPLTQAEEAQARKLEKEGLKHSALMAEAFAELINERVAQKASA